MYKRQDNDNYMFLKVVRHDLPAMVSSRTMEKGPATTDQNMDKTVGGENLQSTVTKMFSPLLRVSTGPTQMEKALL